jgi:hypothetical protein
LSEGTSISPNAPTLPDGLERNAHPNHGSVELDEARSSMRRPSELANRPRQHAAVMSKSSTLVDAIRRVPRAAVLAELVLIGDLPFAASLRIPGVTSHGAGGGTAAAGNRPVTPGSAAAPMEHGLPMSGAVPSSHGRGARRFRVPAVFGGTPN